MQWTPEQRHYHREAAARLEQIKDAAFARCREGILEYEVQQVIQTLFVNQGLVNYIDAPIVAFGQNTAQVHYFPQQETSLPLTPETLILIDIWGKVNRPKAPYADITWMGYFGTKPATEIMTIFQLVLAARDTALEYLREDLRKDCMPTGQEIDSAARDFLTAHHVGDRFLHTLGHSLGTTHVHGVHRGLHQSNPYQLVTNLGYTIEPGVYIKHKVGVRTEINYFVDDEYQLVVTTAPQQELILI